VVVADDAPEPQALGIRHIAAAFNRSAASKSARCGTSIPLGTMCHR
jgi:hypothetical protein